MRATCRVVGMEGEGKDLRCKATQSGDMLGEGALSEMGDS